MTSRVRGSVAGLAALAVFASAHPSQSDAAASAAADPGTGRVTVRPAEQAGVGIERVGGADRFETAALLAARDRGADPARVYVATGGDFPDALGAGAGAANVGAPVLLATRTGVPPSTAERLEQLSPREVVVVGGEQAVPERVRETIRDLAEAPVRRVHGADRFATVAALARDERDAPVPVAYVATGADFADALAATPAAVGRGGPVLLTAAHTLPGATADALASLRPEEVVVLGGTQAVAEDTVERIGEVAGAPVTRVAGRDRYATAAAVASRAFSPDIDTVYLATGRSFPDALAGGAVAGREGTPLLLAGADELPAPTRAALDRLDPCHVVLLGGTAALSAAVARQAAAATACLSPPDGDHARGDTGEYAACGEGFDARTFDWSTEVGLAARSAEGFERHDDNVRLKEDGEVREGLELVDDARILVDGARDAVVRSSRIGGRGLRVYEDDRGHGRAVAEYNDFDVDGNAVTGQAFDVRHNHITATNDGLTPSGGATGTRTTIAYNKIEGPSTRIGDRHHDGVQLWQGGNATIRCNWIDGWDTSAIILKSDRELAEGDGPIRDVVVEGNYLANSLGNYVLYVRDGGKGRPEFVTVRDNVFGPVGQGAKVSTGTGPGDQATFVRTEEDRREGIARQEADPGILAHREDDHGMTGGAARAETWIVWNGNVDLATGEELVPPGGWHEP